MIMLLILFSSLVSSIHMLMLLFFLLETQRESPAEELPFEDGSVDLVTTMSAFHWFDRSRFLQEAHRVLKPHGCLAILNYTLNMELSYGDCSETLNHICKEVGIITLVFLTFQCLSSV